jgi:glycosyl transferase family 25
MDKMFIPLSKLREWASSKRELSMDGVVPVAIISLRDGENRRSRLLAAGLPMEWVEDFFPATDLRTGGRVRIDELSDPNRVVLRYRRRLSPGEVGCALSHKAVYTSFLASRCPLALVLEDDSIPEVGFLERVTSLAAELMSPAESGKSFVCNVGLPKSYTQGHVVRPVRLDSRKNGTTNQILEHLDPRFDLWRANAYFISRRAAEDILGDEPRVDVVADDWSARRRRGTVKHLLLTEDAVFAQDGETQSTIDLGRLNQQRAMSSALKRQRLFLDRALDLALRKFDFATAIIKSHFRLNL